MRGKRTRAAVLFTATAIAFSVVTPARAEAPRPTDLVISVVREACALAWIDGLCDAYAYPDPGYRVDEDPSPDEPFALRIGSMHEHSGYSDGHPGTRPSDIFEAGRTGRNVDGRGDGNTGVIVDYVLSSDHSDNEKLPITTTEACLHPDADADAGVLGLLDLDGLLSIPPMLCSRITEADHYRKWEETLSQAQAATEVDASTGEYVGFTAMRGFEWTNDRFNHVGVYFSRNVANAKIDLSYLDMEFFWNWLRRPAERGGGSDALIVFNHPEGHNWEDLAYVPDVDDRVAGMEVNGGDDLSWYLAALTNGWHLGPTGGEDEHARAWSSAEEPKTLMLTRGRGPSDYYWAMANHRTVSLSAAVVEGDSGEPARYPSVLYWAGPSDMQSPDATVLGGVVEGDTTLRVSLDALPANERVVLVSNTTTTPIRLGQADATGSFSSTLAVTAPDTGEDWYAVVTCPASTLDCGVGETYDVVTAPVWVAPQTVA